MKRLALAVAAFLALTAFTTPTYQHLQAPSAGDNTVTNYAAVSHTTAPSDPPGVMDTLAFGTATHQTRNYAGTTWVDGRSGGADGSSRNAIEVTGTGTQNGIQKGKVSYYQTGTWDDWHYRSGVKVNSPEFVIDGMTVTNEGDAIKLQAGARNTRVARTFVDGANDDCVQADYGADGDILESVFLNNCYGSALSARPSPSTNYSSRTIEIKDSLVEVRDHSVCYGTHRCPGHGGWFKWDTKANGMRLKVSNSTFKADSLADPGSLEMNPTVASCSNVTLDFTGPSSDYAAFLTEAATWTAAGCTGVTVNTGSTAANDYFYKVIYWHGGNDSALG